jgi:hypothetical protein
MSEREAGFGQRGVEAFAGFGFERVAVGGGEGRGTKDYGTTGLRDNGTTGLRD